MKLTTLAIFVLAAGTALPDQVSELTRQVLRQPRPDLGEAVVAEPQDLSHRSPESDLAPLQTNNNDHWQCGRPPP